MAVQAQCQPRWRAPASRRPCHRRGPCRRSGRGPCRGPGRGPCRGPGRGQLTRLRPRSTDPVPTRSAVRICARPLHPTSPRLNSSTLLHYPHAARPEHRVRVGPSARDHARSPWRPPLPRNHSGFRPAVACSCDGPVLRRLKLVSAFRPLRPPCSETPSVGRSQPCLGKVGWHSHAPTRRPACSVPPRRLDFAWVSSPGEPARRCSSALCASWPRALVQISTCGAQAALN